MSAHHAENFPVASIFLPKKLRRAITNIYRFARSADDVADEGNDSDQVRLQRLAQYRQALYELAHPQQTKTYRNHGLGDIFDPLALTIRDHQLALTPFLDLLSAFEQDISQHRYTDYKALEKYCQQSANPIGRLMLHLYESTDAQSLRESDAICTALQLINFWQDVAIDWRKGRIYLPLDEMARFGVTQTAVACSNNNAAWQALMKFQVDRSRALLNSGVALGSRLKGRIGFELRMIIQGGLLILHKIEAVQYDVFYHRPTLRAADWVRIFWRALFKHET
jgi:squalene synthase HpnC